MSLLTELQALDEMLNPKEGRPLIGGITIHSGSKFITRILAELEKPEPSCKWEYEDGFWWTSCEFMKSGAETNFCHGCGGKVEVVWKR